MLATDTAATAIGGARRRAGLTQAQLAKLAGTSQSAIAAYESGKREPTLPTLQRMIRATGQEARLVIEPDPVIYRLADLAVHIKAAEGESRRLRLVFEFLRGAADDGFPLELLVSAEPPATGDPRYDAMLAAIAEDLCFHADLPAPSWVHDSSRFFDGAWWVSDLPSARAAALVHTPASYRRRGVMIERRDLESV